MEIFYKLNHFSYTQIQSNTNGIKDFPLSLNTYDLYTLAKQLEQIIIKWEQEYPDLDLKSSSSTITFWATVKTYTNALGQFIFEEMAFALKLPYFTNEQRIC